MFSHFCAIYVHMTISITYMQMSDYMFSLYYKFLKREMLYNTLDGATVRISCHYVYPWWELKGCFNKDVFLQHVSCLIRPHLNT